MPGDRIHRVLIVDDEPAVRWTIAIPFQRRGVETDVAENGKEAIRLLSRLHCHYCCVLLDLNIPPPDGMEIARFIRDNCNDLPVIIVSGYPDLAERIKDEELGSAVKLVLMKPVDPDFLVRYVHGVNGCIRDQLPGRIDFAVR
ncbi:MAG TPA: response regulator [Thermoanaerobaculia bacterium]|jgi:DNA-binding response OmpR family regulator